MQGIPGAPHVWSRPKPTALAFVQEHRSVAEAPRALHLVAGDHHGRTLLREVVEQPVHEDEAFRIELAIGLVDEDQPLRFQVRLTIEPGLPML